MVSDCGGVLVIDDPLSLLSAIIWLAVLGTWPVAFLFGACSPCCVPQPAAPCPPRIALTKKCLFLRTVPNAFTLLGDEFKFISINNKRFKFPRDLRVPGTYWEAASNVLEIVYVRTQTELAIRIQRSGSSSECPLSPGQTVTAVYRYMVPTPTTQNFEVEYDEIGPPWHLQIDVHFTGVATAEEVGVSEEIGVDEYGQPKLTFFVSRLAGQPFSIDRTVNMTLFPRGLQRYENNPQISPDEAAQPIHLRVESFPWPGLSLISVTADGTGCFPSNLVGSVFPGPVHVEFAPAVRFRGNVGTFLIEGWTNSDPGIVNGFSAPLFKVVPGWQSGAFLSPARGRIYQKVFLNDQTVSRFLDGEETLQLRESQRSLDAFVNWSNYEQDKTEYEATILPGDSRCGHDGEAFGRVDGVGVPRSGELGSYRQGLGLFLRYRWRQVKDEVSCKFIGFFRLDATANSTTANQVLGSVQPHPWYQTLEGISDGSNDQYTGGGWDSGQQQTWEDCGLLPGTNVPGSTSRPGCAPFCIRGFSYSAQLIQSSFVPGVCFGFAPFFERAYTISRRCHALDTVTLEFLSPDNFLLSLDQSVESQEIPYYGTVSCGSATTLEITSGAEFAEVFSYTQGRRAGTFEVVMTASQSEAGEFVGAETGLTALLGGQFVTLAGDCDGETSTFEIRRNNTRPFRPRNLAVTGRGPCSEISLAWEVPPHDGGSPITAYTIQFRRIGVTAWTTFGTVAPPATSVTVTGLLRLGYQFRISATNSVGASEFTDIITEGFALGAPTNLTYTRDPCNQAQLSWTPPAQSECIVVASYRLEYRAGTSGTFLVFGTVAGTQTTGTITGLDPTLQYQFRVARVADAGGDLFSNTATSGTVGAPTNLTISRDPCSEAQLSWTPPAQDDCVVVSSYRLEYRAGTSGTFLVFGTVAGTQTTGTITGLDPTLQYQFRVARVVTGQADLFSSTITSGTSPATPTTVVAALGASPGEVDLTWNAVEQLCFPNTDYLVQFRPSTTSTWSNFTRAASTDKFATVTDLTAGVTYFFRVRATNSIGNSGFSAQSNSVTIP